jgi:DNA-binding response OmpR family regulator
MLCVVDPEQDDYQALNSLAQTCGVQVQLVASAEQALRLARTAKVDLWVINTKLPGLSGASLCGMLKERSVSTPVYLVSNQYTPEAERAAWSARATLFGCKGQAHVWFAQWLEHRQRRPSAIVNH